MVGKAEVPACFQLCGNKPPIAYKNQENAWYDREIVVWWFQQVFGPWYLSCGYRRDQKCILILDNFSGHEIEKDLIPSFIIVIYLPPNVTSLYQTLLDQGILAKLKCR